MASTKAVETGEMVSWLENDVEDYIFYLAFICKVPVHYKYVIAILRQTAVMEDGPRVLHTLAHPHSSEDASQFSVGSRQNQLSHHVKHPHTSASARREPLSYASLDLIAQLILYRVIQRGNALREGTALQQLLKSSPPHGRFTFDNSPLIAIESFAKEEEEKDGKLNHKERSWEVEFGALSEEALKRWWREKVSQEEEEEEVIEAVEVEEDDYDSGGGARGVHLDVISLEEPTASLPSQEWCCKAYYTALEQSVELSRKLFKGRPSAVAPTTSRPLPNKREEKRKREEGGDLEKDLGTESPPQFVPLRTFQQVEEDRLRKVMEATTVISEESEEREAVSPSVDTTTVQTISTEVVLPSSRNSNSITATPKREKREKKLDSFFKKKEATPSSSGPPPPPVIEDVVCISDDD